MAASRQLVLTKRTENGQSSPLGSKRAVLCSLSKFNTSPDGSPDEIGVAHGPGLRVELPMVADADDVAQALVTVLEEEIAWPVLSRLCQRLGWSLMDPETGRTFGG